MAFKRSAVRSRLSPPTTDHKALALWPVLCKKEKSDIWVERLWADFKSEVHPEPFSILG